MFDLGSLVRSNIVRVKPYSSARSEFHGAAEVFLDANENAFGSPAGVGLERYPDPGQAELKELISRQKSVRHDQIFVGNGSDEAIDLLFRIFCEPGRDEAIILPPTYGMYSVAAGINDVQIREVSLTADFAIDADAVLAAVRPVTKLIFFCSPNNPTGNLMDAATIREIAAAFHGIIVVDEAYIDFADSAPFISEIGSIPTLVVLQTFSKAWGMAGARVGMAFANASIIALMDRIKPPYNVSSLAQMAVSEACRSGETATSETIEMIKSERERLRAMLTETQVVETVFPSDANFLLTRVIDAKSIYRFLLSRGVVVRDRSDVPLCQNCLRITVGTPQENDRLIAELNNYVRQ